MKRFSTLILAALALLACTKEGAKEEESKYAADITTSFSVKNPEGTIFQGVIGKDTIIIKVNPYVDPAEVLKDCTPTFFLSMGATVVPSASEPQNFGVEGGVIYTVTSMDGKKVHKYVVTWGPSDKMADGEGFSYCEITDGTNADNDIYEGEGPIGGVTPFTSLGWPGNRMKYYEGESELDPLLYGDLNCYPGYCGDYIVLLSRSYANLGDVDNATKVADKNTLTLAGSGHLNLGSIDVTNLQCITNDWYGTLVAVVDNGDVNDIYYWTDPFQAPTLLGTTTVDITPFDGTKDDAGNNFQVTGDITADAYITAQAPRSPEGNHYMLTVSGGALQGDVQTISTGYSSEDTGGWQMISLAIDEVPCSDPDYILCDNEGENGANWGNQIWINSWDGTNIGSPANPLLQNNLQTWWVGNGPSLYRTGAHRPYVANMVINGKQYALFVGGTMWWEAMAVLDYDLELCTLAHENANVAGFTGTVGWSYGGLGAWYWDRDEGAGYVAAWWGRAGLVTRKLTCYE